MKMNTQNGTFSRMLNGMPMKMQDTVTKTMEQIAIVSEMHNPKIATSMLPSVYRGLWQKKGKTQSSTAMYSGHPVYFDLDYGSDFPEMYELYRRAVANQWDGQWQLDWDTDVDPMNRDKPLLGKTPFVPHEMLRENGIILDAKESAKLEYLDAQPVHARRAGRPLRLGTSYRVRPVDRRQALWRDSGDGRGATPGSFPALSGD